MARTIVHRFRERARSHPEQVALRCKRAGEWVDITWREYESSVVRVARGLVGLRFERGDRLAILAHNCPEWHIADLACLLLGGVTVPVYETSSAEQIAHILTDSEARFVVVDDPLRVAKVVEVRADLPHLERLIGMEEKAGEDITWAELLATGSEVEESAALQTFDSIGPDDPATLVYTSGTTGRPKGVVITHRNIVWTADAVQGRIPIGPGARTLSYLPLSHIAERMVSHFLQIHYGSTTWFAESLATVPDDLRACRPTYFFAVPRVWEKFHARYQERVGALDPGSLRSRLLRRALQVGRARAEAEQTSVKSGDTLSEAPLPLRLRLQHVLFDALVLRTVRSGMGLNECALPLSAAAPLDPELLWFFHSLGIRIAEGYGQTEDTGPTTWNPPEAIKIGTVGPALDGLELKLGDDGEVLARGDNLSPGYFKDRDATRGLIDADGFMHSGDVGTIDALGYLTITERKKDLIITAGGKNVAPQEVESRIKRCQLVSQVVVVGDRRPFLTALITLDEDRAAQWAAKLGLSNDLASLAGDGRLLEEIGEHLAEVNESFARVERVRKFRVLERDFRQEADEMTPTLKVKRRQVSEAYAEVIESMYDEASPPSAWARAPEHTEARPP